MKPPVRRFVPALAALFALASAVACGPRPYGGAGVPPEVRVQYEVTIFTDDPDTGRRVLAAIEALGYTHPGNDVLGTPNDEFNIKWGGAPADVLAEIQGVVEPMVRVALIPRQLFEPDDRSIFINLPVCSRGEAFRPETCPPADAVTEPEGGGDPEVDPSGIPRGCGLSEPAWGSLTVGSEVILGRHRDVEGDANWADEMDAFVGRAARVTELFGVDGRGCPVVHVDVDNGEWFWRVRDMQRPGSAGVPLGTSVGARTPRACGLTDAAGGLGAVSVGTVVRLGQHTPWQGDTNWTAAMVPFVGQETRVRELAGLDGAGCAVVKVDADDGRYFWRVRDLVVPAEAILPEVSAPFVPSGAFPQECGMGGDDVRYGAAVIGAVVRLGRHRAVDGDANWAADMEEFVGRVGRVTEYLGTDDKGCPVVKVDADGNTWAWRVRDLQTP